MEGVKGFKVFNPDWTCKGFQYEVGKTYEEDVKPMCCDRGFHFCRELKDCFNYYQFDPDNKVAEVIALGDIDEKSDGSKHCTDKIQIVREISWQDVLVMVNLGKSCTGYCNTGNRNTGNRNTGNRNTGYRNTGNRNTGNRNTGDCNTGDCNTGDWNTGNWNTGYCNTGDRNTGNWNTGNRNTGDWNTTNSSSGCFNTKKQNILLFNSPSDWTYDMWLESKARRLLNEIQKKVVGWVSDYEMTDEEKEANPTYITTGGYLKVLDETENAQIWWEGLSKSDRCVIKDIPNFDATIFGQVTGIKVE